MYYLVESHTTLLVYLNTVSAFFLFHERLYKYRFQNILLAAMLLHFLSHSPLKDWIFHSQSTSDNCNIVTDIYLSITLVHSDIPAF